MPDKRGGERPGSWLNNLLQNTHVPSTMFSAGPMLWLIFVANKILHSLAVCLAIRLLLLYVYAQSKPRKHFCTRANQTKRTHSRQYRKKIERFNWRLGFPELLSALSSPKSKVEIGSRDQRFLNIRLMIHADAHELVVVLA